MDCLLKAEHPFCSLSSRSRYDLFSCEAQSQTLNSSINVDHSAPNDMNMNDMHMASPRPLSLDGPVSADADLASFLSRKVKLATYTWAVGGFIKEILNPWRTYLLNPAVLRKIENYNLISGTLKVTIYINGSPFHAGITLASYRYLSSDKALDSGFGEIVTNSQRPHVFLNSSTCKGGCICLPFFFPLNFVNATRNTVFDLNQMGTLDFLSLEDLKQVNGDTDSATITVFGEMLDVKLSGPTALAPIALSSPCSSFDFFSLEAQSSGGDEYEADGPISGPASTVAKVAGGLTNVPVIGDLALATSMGAGAVSRFAKFFGFSKPIMLNDVQPMRNMTTSSLALAEGSDLSQKLTVTGKQEMSIDPTSVGLPAVDELSLSYLCQKESIIHKITWAPGATVDVVIAGMAVTPMTELRTSITGATQVVPTALSYISRGFGAWSGTLRYRFQIIASQYHRGRLAIIYEPTGPLGTNDIYNTNFNTIIDLADGRDFTVCVPYQQAMAYLENDFTTVDDYLDADPITASSYKPVFSDANGALYLKVVNELTSPDGTTPVTIIVSISAGDDFELVNPTSQGIFQARAFEPQSSSCSGWDLFSLETQSAAVEETPAEENAPESMLTDVQLIPGAVNDISQKPLIFYGERILSIRQLIKRYCRFRSISMGSAGGDEMRALLAFHAMPPEGGHDTIGPDTTASAVSYAYHGVTYLGYFSRAFAGWKGSIRWKFLPNSGNFSKLAVSRNEGEVSRNSNLTFVPSTSTYVPGTTTISQYAKDGNSRSARSAAGTALSQTRTMDALEVEIPYALSTRFSTVSDFSGHSNNLSNGYPGGNAFSLEINSNNEWAILDAFVAAGEDFNFFGFNGAPLFYLYTDPSA